LTTSVKLENVTKRFGDFVAVDQMNLEIADGEFFSLLGPSGCGKTTTLRMVAGFEQPSEGQIFIMDQQVAGIPAYRRPVNTVFQSYALFPHMTVQQNVAFGLEMAKVAEDEIKRRSIEALELVQMGSFVDRKPGQMSGGQKQRVALARALVNRPKVLLLDEPLGALDLKLRKAMQLELKQIQSEVGITFIYVTHDQEEALTMSDRIAVMHDGLVMQIGAPQQIYEHPENKFVADFIGETNFIDGTVVSVGDINSIDIGEGVILKGVSEIHELTTGQQVSLAIRPEKVGLYSENSARLPKPDDKNVVVKGTVTEAIYIGTDTRYLVTFENGVSIFVREQNQGFGAEHNFSVGDKMFMSWLSHNAQVLIN
jgi:spermidine/putrescine transport system ATP-binding protein